MVPVSCVDVAVCLLQIIKVRAPSLTFLAMLFKSVGRVVMLAVSCVSLFGSSVRNISVGDLVGGIVLS